MNRLVVSREKWLGNLVTGQPSLIPAFVPEAAGTPVQLDAFRREGGTVTSMFEGHRNTVVLGSLYQKLTGTAK